MPKLNLQARSTQSHSVTEYHIYTITEDFFKLTKKELTDLVQVGEVTDIQIMEEDGEIPCSLQLDMEMANESENIQ